MNENSRDKLRLAIHSTHEAAEKIAGIGAVLDGILPQEAYRKAFSTSILVGPCAFPRGDHPLKDVFFDSASREAPGDSRQLSPKARDRLARVAEDFGTRIVFGSRAVGPRSAQVKVDVLLASPEGSRRSRVDAFRKGVRERFRFDFSSYEESYKALSSAPDTSLDRLIRAHAQGGELVPYPEWPAPERLLTDHRGDTFYGGVPFIRNGQERCASFPRIQGLDAFADFEKSNSYLVELQFYFFAAPPLWQATRVLMEERYQPQEATLFAHDWLGVPLLWAMNLDAAAGPERHPVASTVYFAHEARICRLLVEGIVKDKMQLLLPRCHPDGHDVSFYSYLAKLESRRGGAGLDEAFPEVRQAAGGKAFSDIFYHELNCQAGHFDHVVAVGLNVKREMQLILHDAPKQPQVSLCPNGVPDFLPSPREPVASPQGSREILEAKTKAQAEARQRLVEFAAARLGFKPDVIFTSVNRCELSKAPWRSVELFRKFLLSPKHRESKGLLVWLSRPKPLPSDEQVAAWREWGWPLEHRARSAGGDLRREEEAIWEVIRDLNAQGQGRYRILYVNQFGWSRARLGALDPEKSTFEDLRVGTDVEIGLSIYEPFGIAPLEPFSTGAVCVLSDASGCACHLLELERRGAISGAGFVVGKFTRSEVQPEAVGLRALKAIEDQVYVEIVEELSRKLEKPRGERLVLAQAAMSQLSWAAATDELLRDLQPDSGSGSRSGH